MAGVWALAAGLTAAPRTDDTWARLGGLPARLGGPGPALAARPAGGGRPAAGAARGAGGRWARAGLPQVRVSALAASGDAVAAGGDATQGAEPLPLFVSGDAGRTWAAAPGVTGPGGAAAVAGSGMVTALAASDGG